MRVRRSLSIVLSVAILSISATQISAATFYIDCRDGDDDNIGTKASEPWGSIDKINQAVFAPGDSILFKRGTRCEGMLRPSGSGTPGKPLTIGAFGTGALPIIDASGSKAAVMLFNQQYWHINNIDARGSDPYGIYISGDKGTLDHFRLKDIVVQNVSGKVETKRSGLIAVVAGATGQTFKDIIIDGATCYNTTQWAGIVVDGGATSYWEGSPVRAENVTVRNCVVHDVYGDGIILFRVRNGLIEKNVAWNTGMQHTQDVGTPNSMWTWSCDNCIVQFNEGFFADSPGVDAGVFDIDWGCTDNIIQYNYAHDSQGYCVSVFGANGITTTNSIVRYNVCINNARSPRLAKRQGDIFLSTWDGGSLDGVKIHNNTIYWNPPTDTAAILNQAEFVGERPNLFVNNLIVSTVPTLLNSNASLELDHNLYWYKGSSQARWIYGDQEFTGFDSYRHLSGQDQNGIFADPELHEPNRSSSHMTAAAFHLASNSPAVDAGKTLPEMGPHDFFASQIPEGESADIGASEAAREQERLPRWPAPDFELNSVDGIPCRLSKLGGRWILLSFFDLVSRPKRELARTQSVFLRSMLYQFREKGLEVLVVTGELAAPILVNLKYDWQLQECRLLVDEHRSKIADLYAVKSYPTTFLISPDGETVQRWNSCATAPQLGLTLRSLLGPRSGTSGVRLSRVATVSDGSTGP